MNPLSKYLLLSAALSNTLMAAEADLLAGYDQTYASGAGGEDNAQVTIANAVAGSNAINENSGTGARIRIAGYCQAAQYSYQRTSNGGFVGWMANGDSRLADVVAAGDAVGADLVTFICDSTNDGAAAVAEQPGRYSSFDGSAFWSAVVAHELAGHNYGRSHSDGLLNPKTVMLHNYCGGGSAPPYFYTNPNIWFNNVRLVGDGNNCGQGALINAGNNSLPSATSAQAVADRRERVVAGPSLSNVVRRWSFNNPAGAAVAGTVVNDQVSGVNPATVRGTGAVFTGKGLKLPGGGTGNAAANSIAAYIDLPNGLLSSNTNLTIEVWATPLSAASYARILDFGRPVQAGDGLGAAGEYTGTPGSPAPGATQSSDGIMLTSAVGTNVSTQRFEAKLDGTAVTLDSALPSVTGLQHHYVITFSDTASGGRWQWYRDGDAVAFLDVPYHLSGLEDVNNWLGRSMYSGDAMANCEYAEVRVSNVAMSRDQILANYLLGPNYVSTTAALTGSDAVGSTSFNQAGKWSTAAAPSAGGSYESFGYTLRTPATGGAATFAGSSLKISGGKLLYKGTASSTVTVNNLTVSNGTVAHGGSGTCTLAGGLNVADEGATFLGLGGAFNVTANLGGKGDLTVVGNPVTLAGSNAGFTGRALVGDGNAGTLVVASEAQLGSNPGTLVSDQLAFNRGTLQTTATMALDDANRGILFDVSGGTFNVASGTTLTVSSPLSSPVTASNIVVGAMRKSGAGTLVLNSTSSSFKGNFHVDSGGAGNDGIVRVMNNLVLANAHNPIYIENNNAGSSTLQMDGTAGSITLTRVSLAARSGTTPGIQNLAGTNNLGGLTLMAGGANHIVQCDSGLLNFTGGIYSGVTGSRTITFQGNGDIAALSTISELTADLVNVLKQGSGTLTLAGACSHDGTTTLSGGTLRLNGSLTTTGTMTTAAGTVFSGTGSSNAVTAINGTHSPGSAANSTGTQTFTGALAYNAGSKLNWTLASNATTAGASSKVAAQGVTVASGAGGAALSLTLNGPGSTVNFTNGFWTQPRSWTVLTSTGMTGQFSLGSVSNDSAGNPVAAFGSFQLQQTATAVTLAYFPLNSAPPSAPAGLSATSLPGAVTLNWSAGLSGVTYNVRRSTTSGGPYETIATGLAGTTFSDTAVTNGTTYYYLVTGVNQFGESDGSAEVAARPHLPMSIAKADNALALDQPGSWTGGIAPNGFDTATWTGLAGANSISLGSNRGLGGIVVGATGGAVSIGAGNTLTLGTGGFDLGASTQNLTIAAGFATAAGGQTWNVATGKTLALTGGFARGPGSSVVIDRSVNTGTVTASGITNTNGLAGAWATIQSAGTAANNASGGYTYATKDGSNNLVPYVGATALTANYSFTSDATANYDVSFTGNLTYGSTRDANTVRHTGGTTALVTNSTQTWGFNGLMNAGTGTLSLGVGGNAFNIKAGTGTGTELALAAASSGITLGGTIVNNGSNASSLTVTGPNAVLLSGASTYSGGTVLNSGDLQFGANSTPTTGTVTSGPFGTGTVTVNGGTLTARSGNRTLANPVVVNGDFTLNGTAAGANSLTLTGAVDLGAGFRTLTVAATNGAVISGVLSNGGLTKAGAATLVLSGANTYAGGTTLTAGTLRIGNTAALGAVDGSLTVNGGTLDLNALNATVGALSGSGGAITNLTAGLSILTTGSSTSSAFSGALQNGGAGQTLALVKQGTGTLTLTGTSNYSGSTTITGGTLVLNGALTGSSSVTVGNGATLGGSGTSSGPVTLSSGGNLTPGDAAGSGTLSISGALTLNSGGSLTLRLGAPGASTKVSLAGSLGATGTTTVNVAALAGFGPGVYPVLVGSAPVNGANFTLGTTPAGYTYALAASGNTLSLTVASTPAAPTGLTGTGGDSSIALSWTGVTGATGYNVKRSTSSGGGYVTIATGLSAAHYNDPSLAPGTTYYYVVSATNIAGESDDSVETEVTTLDSIEAWRLQKFGTADLTGDSADEADPDKDGLVNLLEYGMGSDPTVANAAVAPTASILGGKLTLSFTRNTKATDVTLRVMASDDLGSTWTEIARGVAGGALSDHIDGTPSGATVTESGAGDQRAVKVSDVSPTAAKPKRFLKLKVTH